MKITGFIHNYPLLSTFITDKQLSMENENFLKYYSLILGGVKAAKLEKKSPCQITCQVDRYQNVDVINDYFKTECMARGTEVIHLQM